MLSASLNKTFPFLPSFLHAYFTALLCEIDPPTGGGPLPGAREAADLDAALDDDGHQPHDHHGHLETVRPQNRLHATLQQKTFYLTTHSTHFIYGYMEGRKENVLINDALNTFYLRLYGRKEGKCFN